MFKDIETAIVARLKDRLPAGTLVTTMSELERIPEYRNRAPAVFVVYGGFQPAETPGPTIPQVQAIELSFTVVVTTKNATGNGSSTAARDDSEALSEATITSLIGYPVGGGKHLRLSAGGAAEYDAGYSYTPIGFTCRRTYKAAP